MSLWSCLMGPEICGPRPSSCRRNCNYSRTPTASPQGPMIIFSYFTLTSYSRPGHGPIPPLSKPQGPYDSSQVPSHSFPGTSHSAAHELILGLRTIGYPTAPGPILMSQPHPGDLSDIPDLSEIFSEIFSEIISEIISGHLEICENGQEIQKCTSTCL